MVRVPSDADEQRRQLQREHQSLTRDRVRVLNRIKGLLATQGLRRPNRREFRARLDHLTRWDGQPLPSPLRDRLAREWEKVELLTTHLKTLERARADAVGQSFDPEIALVRRLLTLRGIGETTAWLFVMELGCTKEDVVPPAEVDRRTIANRVRFIQNPARHTHEE